MDLASMRENYKLNQLNESEININPIIQFQIWFNNAVDSQLREANAMTLSTSDKNGNCSSRIVLLKKFTEQGFYFFTNYTSHKAKQIAENSKVSILFFWNELERQVRIEGIAEKTSKEESMQYFNERPLFSRISAMVSQQSQVIKNRDWLVQAHNEYSLKEENEIKLPDYWGGYIVKPTKFEFWQGRENRLHDRIQYKLINNNWQIERLAP